MIAAVPLAALGFTWILNKITNYIANQPASLLHTRKKLIPIATTLLIFGMIFFPSFEVNGAFFKNSFTSVTLYDIWRIYDSESPSAIYDQAEQNFAQAAQENNLKNQLIANVPFDGSPLSLCVLSISLYHSSPTSLSLCSVYLSLPQLPPPLSLCLCLFLSSCL